MPSKKIILFVLLLTGGTGMAWSKATPEGDGNRLVNGGFEEMAHGAATGWNVQGVGGPKEVSGTWHHFVCNFNSEGEKSAKFYLTVFHGSIGSLWMDHVTLSEMGADGREISVPLENAGFERFNYPREIPGWMESDANTVQSDATRASQGKRSVRITHVNDAVPTTQLAQKLAVKPHTSYRLGFDLFIGDDFQGEAKGLVFDPTGARSLVTNMGEAFASTLVEARDRDERYAMSLSPTAGTPAVVSQETNVGAGMNLQAGVDLDNHAFTGALRLVVEDATTNAVLGEAKVEAAQKDWQSLRVICESKSSRVRVKVVAEGAGEALVDNVFLGAPRVTPSLQKVEWLPAGENFVLPASVGVSVEGAAGPALEGGLELLRGDLKKDGVALGEPATGQAPFRILIGEKYAVPGKGPEAYELRVDHGGVAIRAGREAGAFYGLMTVAQLVAHLDGRTVLSACEATDYPDMEMRGVLYGDPEEAARWKMNTLMLSTGTPTTEQEWRDLQAEVEKYARLNLRVIPYFITLTNGGYVEKRNPNLASGVWVQDDPVKLQGVEPSPLTYKCVIRTKLADIEVTSADHRTKYVAGVDYEVIDGDMSLEGDPAKLKPFAIARKPGSAIPDHARVFASYNYLSHARKSTGVLETVAYCPAEPATQDLMGGFMQTLTRKVACDYVNVADCLQEFDNTEAQLATDSRIAQSGKKPVEWLASDVNVLNRAAKKGNPAVRMLQWAGQVNDYSRAAAPLLPRDALINIWGYDANWPATYGREAIAFWAQHGFTTSVMPWNNLRNVRGWAQVAAEAKRKDLPCIGMIDSCWPGVPNPTGGMRETAAVSWKTPSAGEPGFVSLNKASP